MNPASSSNILRKATLSHRFTIITVMFLTVLLGLLMYTIATIQKEKSNAILIDMAGRQRMLFQKHMNEVFLTSQGVSADYTSTRELLRSTLNALMEGGSVVLDLDTGKRQTIPAIPTEKIFLKLHEQKNHFKEIIELADDFLLLAPDHPEFRQKLKILRARNSILIAIADDAVKQLDRYAESIMATMVKWEAIIALFVGLLGIYITRQGIRDGRKIEKEILVRTRAESALRESELFLNSIVENIPDMIFVKDAKNLRFLRFNKAGEELLGRSRDSLIGKTDYDFFPQEQATFFTTKDHEVLANKNSLDIPEEIIYTNSHGTRYLHTKKIPILDNHGTPQYLLGISQDITEQKKAELERLETEKIIRRGERKFRAIYEQAPTGIATLDSLSGQFTQINQKYCDITGYSQQEMLDRTFQELTHPDDLQANMDHMQRLLTGQVTNFQLEKRYIQKNGAIIWVNLTCVPLWLEASDSRQHIAMVQDITSRKLAEKALQESEERYRTLYEDNPSMYFTVAQDGEILSVNQFGAQQLGYTVEELIGQPVIGVFLEDDKPLAQEHFNACLQGSRRLYFWELRKQRKDGSVLWVREVARTIQGEDGKTVGLIVCEDITERKQTEERLRQSEAKETEALRQSDELKSALLASVSHELRTPLTAMKGSVSSIIGNDSVSTDQEREDVLKGIDREINYMSHLVNNLLDMSQIEAGTLIPHKEWHLLEDLVEGALRRTAQTVDTRNIEISIPENIPPIFVDAVEIQQVLINLLDNAVKYSSPASPIRIHVRVEAQQITVEASNMGEPIQPQDLERIFDRFYRRPPPRTQPIRGTGLGLAICKGIVEAHGGRIWADSIGQEVTIAFTIPITESMPSFSLEGRHKSQHEL
ncbi:MAG: PAS domain S-box protein [Nitrospirota bacterium]|nr:PAS domain S-box protein [Nitrospirota bacterium]